jgi:hypothetical protein
LLSLQQSSLGSIPSSALLFAQVCVIKPTAYPNGEGASCLIRLVSSFRTSNLVPDHANQSNEGSQASFPANSSAKTTSSRRSSSIKKTFFGSDNDSNTKDPIEPAAFRISWLCTSGDNDANGNCLDKDKNAALSAGATVSYNNDFHGGYDVGIENTLFSTNVESSNAFELSVTTANLGTPTDKHIVKALIPSAGGGLRRLGIASICSYGSYVRPPSACLRQS